MCCLFFFKGGWWVVHWIPNFHIWNCRLLSETPPGGNLWYNFLSWVLAFENLQLALLTNLITPLPLLPWHPFSFLPSCSLLFSQPTILLHLLLIDEWDSFIFSLSLGGGVRWSVNSYRLCLLPFFHFTIHFHGDRTAGWEAPGSKVKSDHLLNSSLWFPLGITYCNPKTLGKYLSLQRQTTKGGRGKRRKRSEKRGGLQSQGQVLFSAVFSDGLWRLYMGGIVLESSLYLLRGRIWPTLCSPCAQIKLSL